MADYDVIVIGAGPGGYVCAIRCAQLGLRTACVEGRETLGGTCLNIGCIPSKALLHASELYHAAEHDFAKMGLKVGKPAFDWPGMQAYKQSTVEGNTKGIEFLFKKNKVDWLKGWGTITAPGEVRVGDAAHKAKSIVIATGSEPSPLKGVEVDEKIIVTSTGALALGAVPKRLAVIGAGVIGLELGSVYARLGSEVTVIEFLDQITPGVDMEVVKTFQKLLTRQGLKFVLGAAVQGASQGRGRRHPRLQAPQGRQRRLGRGRRRPRLHRPPPLHGRRRPRRRRRGADRPRPGADRRPLADQRPRHPRDRRRDRRPDARPQGRGRGHGGRRDHRRPARPRELRRDPVGDLHLARGRERRRDRGGAEGGGPRATRSASSRSWATRGRSPT